MTQTRVRYRGNWINWKKEKKKYHFQLHMHVIPNIWVKKCKNVKGYFRWVNIIPYDAITHEKCEECKVHDIREHDWKISKRILHYEKFPSV